MSDVVTLEAHGVEVDIGIQPGDHISERIREGRFYETDLLEDIYRRAPSGCAIDVGAHIGNHSLFFSQVCGMDVVAFEPDPESYRLLVGNVNRNVARVEPLFAAAGRTPAIGTVERMRDGNSGMTRVIVGEGPTPVVPIDRLNVGEISLIKIDTEGAEVDVICGAKQTIARDKPLIYVETTENLHRIERLLFPYGYERFGRFCKTPTYGFAA